MTTFVSSSWIQTSCPRLSIDWGAGFQTPILTPYEVHLNTVRSFKSSSRFARLWSLFVKSNGKVDTRWTSMLRIVWDRGHRTILNIDRCANLVARLKSPMRIQLLHATLVLPLCLSVRIKHEIVSLFFTQERIIQWLFVYCRSESFEYDGLAQFNL
jgi:hypothetical protein